ncbi:MAG: efflux transporter outer membrane subunit [Alphaproteobacteria bacterium]|nr:efflux transporter outer membrane subunit [Alphaproteobacteria bacterium]MBU0859040.1 efflux transporter outer membrane subunit [Alphaproteobacteria bacterium]
MKKTTITLPLLLILLSGCALSPDYQRPSVDVPAQWSVAETGSPTVIARDWWAEFESAELNGLMNAALNQNNDLRAGLQRVEQARAGLRIAGASLLPSASASGGATQSRTNPAQGSASSATSLRAGVDISYELDLFGANRAGVNAANAGLEAQQYNQEALALVVMGDVAAGYFQILNLRERLVIADTNLANAREVMRIVNARVREGMESDLELAQQTASVASNEAARETLVQQITNAENALAVLLGQLPQTIAIEGGSITALTIPAIAPVLPSSLLERRPDLRAAEAGLVAANANIGIARAAFFPSLSLGLGQSLSTPGFGDPATTVLSLAAGLAAPLFQGGRLEGGVEQATARQLELAENYRKAVLVAFQEVEDALAAERAAQARETALQTAMTQAQRAYRLSKSRYDAGAIDFQTLLDTQNAQLSAEDNYAQARLARLNAAIDLFKALGGGWQGPRD